MKDFRILNVNHAEQSNDRQRKINKSSFFPRRGKAWNYCIKQMICITGKCFLYEGS